MNKVSKKTEWYLCEEPDSLSPALKVGLYTNIEFNRDSDFNLISSLWLNPKGKRVKNKSHLYYLNVFLEREVLFLKQDRQACEVTMF